MSLSDAHPGDTLPFATRQFVARARESFEQDWRSGGRPRIEDHLGSVSESERPLVLHELIALELELRLEGGDGPTLEEFLSRFPDACSVVTDLFASSRDSSAFYLPEGLAPVGYSEEHEATTDHVPGSTTMRPLGDAPRSPMPRRLGRYQILGLLGKGSFGCVYRARDGELGREVAVKVPTARALAKDGQLKALLAEARLAAGLRHPAIVGVYDVGRSEDGSPFIVLEYVKGTTLAQEFARERMEPTRVAELLTCIAGAIQYSHESRLIHRDLKPSNIMIDEQGLPRVADFGMALTEDLRHDKAGEVAGTPTHMAPEQVRGESHRLDARTDIWALGVILYQGLTGKLPFVARQRAVLFDLILQHEPTPPRQIDAGVPRELQRICLKCLSKRMADRYAKASELVDDLAYWLAEAQGPASSPKSDALSVMPKGLRAFDGDDADFFLSLLPGARTRDGLPESIRFWKAWAEARDDDPTRAAGLLYGPSGAGKSSLVKAGLLPVLGESVRPVYVEATRTQTETRLLAGLRRAFPALTDAEDLPQAAFLLREGQAGAGEQKALIVIDQFEQWLQSDPADPEAELIRALRQCDGQRLQVLILVRDDFWMPITRFFKLIEVAVVEGRNSVAVEVFDPAHARRVLADFGRACGQIPGGAGEQDPEVSAFLEQAVTTLAGPAGDIPPVHLSLFYEVVRKRPWTRETLRALGGVEGIGITFLEETFEAGTAPPLHRLHRDAAQSVLRRLLPAPGSVLRGGLCPVRDLQEASGYADRPDDFADLIRILDSELRMVTPVRPDEHEGVPAPAGPPLDHGGVSYQLAHEFLITPIRQWIDREQRASRTGRAAIRLATITASWCENPIPQRLASPLEWAGILWHIPRSSWSPDERRMMRAAIRRSLMHAGAGLAVAAVLGLAGLQIRHSVRGDALVEAILKADFANMPPMIKELKNYRGQIERALEAREATKASLRDRRLASLLLYREAPTEARATILHEWIREAGPDEVRLIRVALARGPEAEIERLGGDFANPEVEPGARLRIACVLAELAPATLSARKEDGAVLAKALLAEDRTAIPRWLGLLRPRTAVVIPTLRDFCRDGRHDASTRSVAAEALAGALTEALSRTDAAPELARAVIDSRDDASLILRKALERLGGPTRARAVFEAELARLDEAAAFDPNAALEAARCKVNAAIGLAALGNPEPLWPLLLHGKRPEVRAVLIERLANSRLAPSLLLKRLALDVMDPVERQALLLAWAEATTDSIDPGTVAAVMDRAKSLFLNDPDGGVHSAAELLASRWKSPELVDLWKKDLQGLPKRPGRQWEPGPNGHTMVFLRGPLVFRMGSPDFEAWRIPNERQHLRRIDRSIAVATKEVTVEQLMVFDPAHSQDLRHSRESGCPANNVTLLQAVGYCNWLSAQARLEPFYEIRPEGLIVSKGSECLGYRLPTEAEAEYFDRCRSETAYPFGDSEDLLPSYDWIVLNARGLLKPVGQLLPNEFGLFDTLGNVMERCHDASLEGERPYPRDYPMNAQDDPVPDPITPRELKAASAMCMLRGGWSESPPGDARPAYRHTAAAKALYAYVGFRVVRTLPDEAPR